MSSEALATETTPLRRPESRNSETFSNNATPTRNALNTNSVVTNVQLNSATTNNAAINRYSNNIANSNTSGIHLNHNNNNNNYNNIITAPTIPATIKMDTNKRILCRVGLDIIILIFVAFPILCFYIWGDSFKRGFFCNDESLMHPYKDSTVKTWMLYVIGLVLPIAVIITVEFIKSKLLAKRSNGNSNARRYVFMDYEIPDWLVECYKKIGVFGFGAAVSQLTTDIAKYAIGRLRPHFFAVCQPIMPDGTTCADAINAERYIIDFKCAGIGYTASILKDVRLSFPSGHSSFTFFTMVYVALYLQSRMTWRGSKLLRHFLQFALIMIAWYTALSRVSDYKHHWSDVLSGALLGSLIAILVANYVSDLFQNNKEKTYILPRTTQDMPPQTITVNGN